MKIRVEHKDGKRETLTLVPPIAKVTLGNQLNWLQDATGMDHYFDLDGYYDGWGMGVSSMPEHQVGEVIEGVEMSREIEPAP